MHFQNTKFKQIYIKTIKNSKHKPKTNKTFVNFGSNKSNIPQKQIRQKNLQVLIWIIIQYKIS